RTELGIASSLWSEHCSYKSSKIHLRRFPTEGARVRQGPGENAGAVDVGHGWVAVFKMESHNHPSYIEPYQGAATGVGGILRDVFTMGARPIALMDALRFGRIDAPRMRHLIDGVVRGIGDYGNCVGVPTVGGETDFHPSYDGNILVNAFALGLAREDAIFRAGASGVGNPLLYVGSRTGRDGIRGATMASASFDEDSAKQRPAVQVGDPFTEKILIEACLEVMQTGAVVAIQDMGAAGLTSTSFEMAGKGGLGIHMQLERVPRRARFMTPYELMLSESQERMLLVVERGREEEVEKVFGRWDLSVATIGALTEGGRARLTFDGAEAADLPILPLTENAPVYDRPRREPADLAARQTPPEVPALEPEDALRRLLATPELGTKAWIWGQYDHTVRGNTVVGPGADAAVLRLKGTPSALALTCEVNPVYTFLDPYLGGAQAVAESVRNLACVGAEAAGLTDCLNFGSPEIPEIAWQLERAVAGMAEACRALDVPVVSGNVSLYNTTDDRSIHPTPAVAVVGVIETLGRTPSAGFVEDGDAVVLLGAPFGPLRETGRPIDDGMGGSAYLRLLFDIEQGRPPAVDLAAEMRLARLLRALVADDQVRSAHDLSKGGLAVALAEMCFVRGLGVDVRLDDWSPAALFAEHQGRALVAAPAPVVDGIAGRAALAGVPLRVLGTVAGDALRVVCDGASIDAPVEDLRRLWTDALPRALDL
ncbi:MAG: phosphoribosylformylglycinamidine synthase subunit PurL, partial [Acidobacteriota bacterium]